MLLKNSFLFFPYYLTVLFGVDTGVVTLMWKWGVRVSRSQGSEGLWVSRRGHLQSPHQEGVGRVRFRNVCPHCTEVFGGDSTLGPCLVFPGNVEGSGYP